MTKSRFSLFALILCCAFLFSTSEAGPLTSGRIFQKYAKKSSYERLNQALYYVHNQYVDPTRIHFSKMFVSSIKQLSLHLAELSYKKSKNSITVTLVNQSKEFSTKISSIYALRNQVSDLLVFVDQNKKSEIKHGSVEEFAIAGILNTLDPHSVFLSQDVLKETNVDIEGKFGGLGIVIGFRDGHLTVISPIDDTPAARAGIEAGDRITKIEKEPTTGMTLLEAVSKMRGPRGTPINISVLREGQNKEMPFSIVRDVIQIINIDSALLSNNIGYIKLKRFDKSAARDIAYEIQTFQSTLGKDPSGIILDLRNNPGGLLDQAIHVSDLFLEKGGIVSTVERNNRFSSRTKARKSKIDFLYPMVLLINQGSASASEIVAGALQKNNRALLIGQKTFGKGTVQKIFELPKSTALKLTVSKYLTVNDTSIQSIGIKPDIETQPVWIQKDFIRFQQYWKTRSESDLDRSFANYEKTNQSLATMPYLVPDKEGKREDRLVQEYQFSKLTPADKEKRLFETFEIELAHKILSEPRIKNLSRTELFENSKSLLSKIDEENQNEIQLALGKKGIDWTYPPKPSTFCDPKNLEISTNLPNKKGGFEDGSKIELVTSIKNKSDCTFYQVKGISTSKNPVFDQHFIYIGRIEPKQEVSISSTLEVPESQPLGLEFMKIAMTDSDEKILHEQDIKIPFTKLLRPSFKVAYELNNKKAVPELTFTVENIGTQESKEVLVQIKQVGTKTLNLETSRKVIENLKPGQSMTKAFPIKYASTAKKSDQIILSLQCADLENRVVVEKEINISNLEGPGVVQAPQIEVEKNSIVAVTGKKNVQIKGTISDDNPIKDMYIFVNDEKIYYRPFAMKNKRETFEVTLPLTEQENTIQIVSRDENDIQGGVEVHVLRNI